jgi:hypothetical protein
VIESLSKSMLIAMMAAYKMEERAKESAKKRGIGGVVWTER